MAAPAASARILPRAAPRVRGTSPQSVLGLSRAAGRYFSAPRMRPATVSGVSTALRDPTSITPSSTSLSPGFPEHRRIDPGRRAFNRNLVHAAAGEQRQGHAVMSPVRVLRLPGQHQRRAVAVADVHRPGRAHAVHGALQRLDSPLPHFIDEDVEARLVELDDVGAGIDQRARFGVEDVGKPSWPVRDGRRRNARPPRRPRPSSARAA